MTGHAQGKGGAGRAMLPVYPVSLLVAGRPCLIVGGGKVAVRKAAGLLDAGAAVTVVSPEVDERLAEWIAVGRVRHIRRVFEPGDPSGHVLVFSATGSRQVNRRVLEACRAARVLCCPVDGNWVDGDFVTPATFRKDALTVAVSTGGQSCRRSRMIKESLLRHVEMVDHADCLVLGTSHQELRIGEREAFHLRGARMEAAGRMLQQVWGVHEFLLLDTCNRVELIAVTAGGRSAHELVRRVMGFDALPAASFYMKQGFAAFEHVALLAAGLLSQMPGEGHIVAQIKDALADAAERGWAAGMMAEWVSGALHISKDIRREWPALWGRDEIEDACLAYVKEAGPGAGARIAVLGSGVVGRGIVQRAAAWGQNCEWVYHRRPPVGTACPRGVRVRPWRDLADCLGAADVVIAATAGEEYAVTAAMAPALGPERPVLMMDLGIPRNIDPGLSAVRPGVRVIDLDVLKAWHWGRAGSIEPVLESGRAVVQGHRTLYRAMIASFQGHGAARETQDGPRPVDSSD